MSFYSRRKKKDEKKAKKKWQLAASDDSGDDAKEGGAVVNLDCCECEGEADIFCNDCEKHFCVKDFASQHPLDEAADEKQNEKTVKQNKTEDDSPTKNPTLESQLSKHRCRLMLGSAQSVIDTLGVGWFDGEERTQHEKLTARKMRKRKSMEELESFKKKAKEKEDALREQEAVRLAAAAAERKSKELANRLPDGFSPNTCFRELPDSVKNTFLAMFTAGKVHPRDLDESIFKSLKDFQESTANDIVAGFQARELAGIRNKTGFFIGILKTYRRKGVGLKTGNLW